jgi:hypothetical protein
VRKALSVLFGAVFTIVVTAAGAGAAQPPPSCDPGACIDPVDVVERAVCYVGEQLGLTCID